MTASVCTLLSRLIHIVYLFVKICIYYMSACECQGPERTEEDARCLGAGVIGWAVCEPPFVSARDQIGPLQRQYTSLTTKCRPYVFPLEIGFHYLFLASLEFTV